MGCAAGTGMDLQTAAPWWMLVAALFGAGCLSLAVAIGPELRRWRALRQARRQDADARALLQIADALQAYAPSLHECGLDVESARWARLCRRAAHERLAVINELLLLSMPGPER